MKNFIKYTILFILNIIFIFACSQKDNVETTLTTIEKNDFPQTIKLENPDKILDDDEFHHFKIFVIDTVLLTTSQVGDYHYNAFLINTLDFLGSFGVRGEAPEEWTMPITMSGQYETSKDGLNLWFYDYLKGHFSKINLTKTLNSNSLNPIIDETVSIDTKKFPFTNLFYVSEEKIIGDSWISESDRRRIKSFNPKTEEVKKSELFPAMKNTSKLPAEVLNSFYTSAFSKHPTKPLFVQAMFVFNRIDIFNENLQVVKTIVDGDNGLDDYYDGAEVDLKSDFLLGKIQGYDGVTTTSDYIFALEMNVKTQDQIKPKDSYVRVYDWSGKPVCLLQFEHPIVGLAVDERTGILYITDYENESVLRYNIKNLMDEWKN